MADSGTATVGAGRGVAVVTDSAACLPPDEAERLGVIILPFTLVVDGAGYHVAKALAVPDNVTLVALPPYSPELNPMENVWEYLRGNKLAITVFDSYDDIVDTACDAWNFFAHDPDRIASITTRSWATVIP